MKAVDRFGKRIRRSLGPVALAALAAILLAGPVADISAANGANCRFGITTPSGVAGYDLPSLGVGAYLDWGMRDDPVAFDGIEYVQVVRLRDRERRFVLDPAIVDGVLAGVRAVAAARPGSAWLVGNEPDTAYENQDALTPDEYAQAYHAVYAAIKAANPSARVGIGTIVQPTPLRLKWLDQMWAAYKTRYGSAPPSDFWSIHSFILREKAGDWGTGIPPGLTATSGVLYSLEQTDSLAIFRSRLLTFRQWMAGKGERAKPLWITEYGSLLPHDGSRGYVTFPIARTRRFMLGTFDHLRWAKSASVGNPNDDDRLVQRWFWYSLNDYQWKMGGGLFDPEQGGARTLLGDAFAEYVQALPVSPDLKPTALTATALPAPQRGVALTVSVANVGNGAQTAGFEVTAYDGDPARGGALIGTAASVGGGVPGCGEVRTAMLVWENAGTGRKRIYVWADPAGQAPDANRSNNRRAFIVNLPQ